MWFETELRDFLRFERFQISFFISRSIFSEINLHGGISYMNNLVQVICRHVVADQQVFLKQISVQKRQISTRSMNPLFK